MYRAAGIPAYYALVGTRQVGHLEREIPMSQFNHAIAVADIGGKLVWMDPTAETAAWGELPGADQEQWALVFFPDRARFVQVPLTPPDDNRAIHRMQVEVEANRAVTVDYRLTTRGAQDMDLRSFKYLKPARRKQVIQDWINSMAPGATLEHFAFSVLDDYTQPVSLQVRYRAPDYLSRAGDFLVLRVPGARRKAVACGSTTRRYPLVFFTTSAATLEATILLPPQFALEYVPDPVELDTAGLSYAYRYEVEDHMLAYTSTAVRSTTRIPVEDYPRYKQFMEEAARRSQDHVLLRLRESGAPPAESQTR
jgi:hypothetical protein